MKKIVLALIVTFAMLVNTSFAQSQEFDLAELAKNSGIDVFNRKMTTFSETLYNGIRLSKEHGEGVAWINGVEFSEGIIEFDVRGEDLMQHSFVGIAFHGKDNKTFDAVYLRPFQFKAEEEESRRKQIQYISLPDFTWRTLREKFPGVYENQVDPAPDPNSWFKVRIVVKGQTISAFINGSKEPSLVVEKLTKASGGKIGLYVADTSGGDFANLSITNSQ